MAKHDVAEVRIKDKDPEYQDERYDTVYQAVEVTPFDNFVDGKIVEEKRWVVNFEEPYNAFTVSEEDIDGYIQLFEKLKSDIIIRDAFEAE